MASLRAWRKARNITIEQLSASLGVTSASLSRIERGKQWPSQDILIRIEAETTGDVTANDFISARRESSMQAAE